MSIQEAYKELVKQLSAIYESREAAAIAHWVMTHLTGYNKAERLIKGGQLLNTSQAEKLSLYLKELLLGRPVQYVLGEAWFGPLKLYTDERVLVPRPETEELVEWIAEEQGGKKALSILDIGTGSGCIPILLQRLLADPEVHALDVSEGALEVARMNAATYKAPVQFHHIDILEEGSREQLPVFSCIVSNPPYIREQERADMHENVLAYEPAGALFVADDNALLFYNAIGLFALKHLISGGSLYFEINEALGQETVKLLASLGYDEIVLKQDLQGKDRMIRALRP